MRKLKNFLKTKPKNSISHTFKAAERHLFRCACIHRMEPCYSDTHVTASETKKMKEKERMKSVCTRANQQQTTWISNQLYIYRCGVYMYCTSEHLIVLFQKNRILFEYCFASHVFRNKILICLFGAWKFILWQPSVWNSDSERNFISLISEPLFRMYNFHINVWKLAINGLDNRTCLPSLVQDCAIYSQVHLCIGVDKIIYFISFFCSFYMRARLTKSFRPQLFRCRKHKVDKLKGIHPAKSGFSLDLDSTEFRRKIIFFVRYGQVHEFSDDQFNVREKRKFEKFFGMEIIQV